MWATLYLLLIINSLGLFCRFIRFIIFASKPKAALSKSFTLETGGVSEAKTRKINIIFSKAVNY